jgi:hypothetical protein
VATVGVPRVGGDIWIGAAKSRAGKEGRWITEGTEGLVGITVVLIYRLPFSPFSPIHFSVEGTSAPTTKSAVFRRLNNVANDGEVLAGAEFRRELIGSDEREARKARFRRFWGRRRRQLDGIGEQLGIFVCPGDNPGELWRLGNGRITTNGGGKALEAKADGNFGVPACECVGENGSPDGRRVRMGLRARGAHAEPGCIRGARPLVEADANGDGGEDERSVGTIGEQRRDDVDDRVEWWLQAGHGKCRARCVTPGLLGTGRRSWRA